MENNYPQSTFGLNKKKILPTFGISFGLPYPTGGYPINPFNGHPAPNPHFGSISPNGLNLGLVNVNPLVSLQVQKTEYGEKLVKPLVNLHVTPNEHLIHHVGKIFQHKKQEFLNKHQHYHHHTHYPSYAPHAPYPSQPEVYYPPPRPFPAPVPHPPFYHESPRPRPPIFFPPSDGPIEFGSYGLTQRPHYNHIFHHRPSSGPSFIEPDFDSHGPLIFARSSNSSTHQSAYPSDNKDEFNVDFTGNGYAENFNYKNHNQYNNHKLQYHSSNYKNIPPTQIPGQAEGSRNVKFPNNRRKRSLDESEISPKNSNYVKENNSIAIQKVFNRKTLTNF